MTVEMENCRVLVSDQKIEQMKDILPVLEQITRQNQPLLIVTEDITGGPCNPIFSKQSLPSSVHAKPDYAAPTCSADGGQLSCIRVLTCYPCMMLLDGQ